MFRNIMAMNYEGMYKSEIFPEISLNFKSTYLRT